MYGNRLLNHFHPFEFELQNINFNLNETTNKTVSRTKETEISKKKPIDENITKKKYFYSQHTDRLQCTTIQRNYPLLQRVNRVDGKKRKKINSGFMFHICLPFHLFVLQIYWYYTSLSSRPI